ncbi:MAG: DUF2007 domain-containing protein [Clostridia bacterium]|nr:DUF2007 domain-containing protein [Clostridia bacterium]MDR3644340.1 DUF2007 domain-containing protein [Clostridia bacterium]
MPRCPKCEAEYNTGAVKCPYCGWILDAGQFSPAAEEPPPDFVEEPHLNDGGGAFLCSVAGNSESAMAEGRLKSAGIPVYIKQREIGGYMRVLMGYSVYGADLYVPEDQLDAARDALQLGNEADAVAPAQEEKPNRAGSAYRVATRVAAAILAVLFILFSTSLLGAAAIAVLLLYAVGYGVIRLARYLKRR